MKTYYKESELIAKGITEEKIAIAENLSHEYIILGILNMEAGFEMIYEIDYFFVDKTLGIGTIITDKNDFDKYIRSAKKEIRRLQTYGKDYESIIFKKCEYRRFNKKFPMRNVNSKRLKI